MTKKIIGNALADAGLTALYVIFIATFLTYAKDIFGPDEPKTVLVPIMMLLLVIISAAITGALVLGRPIMWYLDGRKKEALYLFGTTLVWLFAFALVLILVLSK